MPSDPIILAIAGIAIAVLVYSAVVKVSSKDKTKE
jgi:hypothetical protein